MLKNEPVKEDQPGLTGSFVWSLEGEKGEFMTFGRRGRQLRRTMGMSCREKIWRAKGHLELNLATAIKDNRKFFL